MIDIASIVYSK